MTADFSTGSDTDNNPADWFTGYVFSSNKISIPVATALSDTGLSTTDVNATQGDVRAVYLALAEALYDAYDAAEGTAATTSNRLKMTKSQAVQDVAGTTTGDIRYTTYTIHIQEEGQASGGTSFAAPSFNSSGVRAE